MNYSLNQDDTKEMLEHWHETPANAYRGSRYGENHNRTLLNAMSVDVADILVDKLKEDIPLFGALNSDAIGVYSEDIGFDKKVIHLSVGQVVMQIDTLNTEPENYTGDTFYADAQ